jgi:hypothetical protein
MTEAELFFTELLKEIPKVKPGKMFGSLCMKTPNVPFMHADKWKRFVMKSVASVTVLKKK